MWRKHCEQKEQRWRKTESECSEYCAVQRRDEKYQEGAGDTRQRARCISGVGNGGEQRARSGRTLEAMGGVRGF